MSVTPDRADDPASPIGRPRSRLLVLEAGRSTRRYWRDLWDYRELFFVLAWRDLAVRYKQTAFGVAWAILRPLLTMLIFTIVFGKLAKLPSAGQVPYPLLVYAGMLPWFLFSGIVSDASNSLVSNAHLVGKVYFPRLVLPLSSVVVALADCAISLLPLGALLGWYRITPDWRVAFLPAFLVLGLLAAIGPSLIIASLNVRYRDFRFVIPFALQVGLYVSPVGFLSDIVPEAWRWAYSLNPLVGVIDGARWSLFGGQAELDVRSLAFGVAVVLFNLAIGVVYFRRTEKTLADHV